MATEIRLELFDCKGSPVLVVELQEITWTPIPLPTPDKNAPKVFRCFVCLRKLGKKQYAGRRANQDVCRHCWPWVDDWRVAAMVKFDKARV